MYAIFETGGKQYTAKVGDVLYIEKLNAEVDQTVTFEKVLAVGDDTMTFGTPYVEGMTVSGKVLKNGKAKKIVVMTYRPKKDSKRKMGHRQPYTKVEITAVGTAAEEKPAKKAAAPKAEGEKKPAAKKAAAPKAEGEKKPAAKKAAAPKADGEKKTLPRRLLLPRRRARKSPLPVRLLPRKLRRKVRCNLWLIKKVWVLPRTAVILSPSVWA